MEIAARSPADLVAPLALAPERVRTSDVGAAKGYRAPVDGLRAMAVGAIVLFHFGVAPFSGGFVGVDVFFVISGFLITRLLLDDIEAGRPVLAAFYKRRILRLYPALFVMLTASFAAALLLLFPIDLKRFGESLASVAGLGSNMYFRNTFGYFSSAADQKPLLHTWSLSVEEQFYLVYPLVLAILARRSRRTAAVVLGALTVASLGASAWATQAAPVSAFYLAPYRFWELMLGGLIPLAGLAAPRARWAAEALAWGGFGLIAGSVFGYTVDTPFPGLAALPPCFGAAAIILACERAQSNGLARLLSLPPVVGLGRISYSLYLWHWPVLVFAGQWLLGRPSTPQTVALIALSLALALFSYRFIEQPFRLRAPTARARGVFAGAATAMVLTALCGATLVTTHGLPQRFPGPVRAILGTALAAAKVVPHELGCLDAPAMTPAGQTCHIGTAVTDKPDFAVWGDSLAGNLMSPLAEAARAEGRSGFFAEYHSCPPLDGVEALRVPGCRTFNADMQRLILDNPEIRTVVLVSFWSAAVRPLRPEPGRSQAQLRDDASRDASLAENHQAFARGLERLVAALTAHGKRVVIVASVPEVGVDVPEALAHLALGRGSDPSPLRQPFLDRHAAAFATFGSLAVRYGARVLYPHELLCPDETCAVAESGRPLYFDAAHLNFYGAMRLRPLFAGLF